MTGLDVVATLSGLGEEAVLAITLDLIRPLGEREAASEVLRLMRERCLTATEAVLELANLGPAAEQVTH